MWPQDDFCSGDIYITLSDKKNQIPKTLPVGFCAPEMLTKCCDFEDGMGFDN